VERPAPSDEVCHSATAALERHHRLLFYAVLLFALALRLLGLSKGIWLDEFSTLDLIASEDLLRALQAYDHPPLYFVLIKLWSTIHGGEPFVRLLSVLFEVLTVAIIMIWIRRYSLPASLLSGLACAAMPEMLRFSQEIRGYSLLLLASAIAFYFASRIAFAPGRLVGYAGVAAALSVAVSTHFVGAFVVPAVTLFVALSAIDLRRIRPLAATAALAVPTVIFLFFYLFFMDAGARDKSGGWWMPLPSLELIERYLGVSRSAVLVLIPVSIVFVAILLWAGNWRRSLPFLAGAACYWTLLIAYSFLNVPIFWTRTALPGLVPLLGFASLQLASVRTRAFRRVLVFGLLVCVLASVANWTSDTAWKPVEEWREIGRTVKSEWNPSVLVVFFPAYVEGPVRHYFPELPANRTISLNNNANEEQLRSLERRIRAGDSPTVLLVERHSLAVQDAPETRDRIRLLLRRELAGPAVVAQRRKLSVVRYGGDPAHHP